MLPWPAEVGGTDDRPDLPSKGNGFFRPTNEKFWASADYTISWMQQERAPGPLATTGFIGDLNAGALGQPGTAVVFGSKDTDFGMFSGIRVEAGFFLDADNCFSLEGVGQYVFPNHQRFALASDAGGNPLIARPVTDAASGIPVAFVDSLPTLVAGGISIDQRSEFIARR